MLRTYRATFLKVLIGMGLVALKEERRLQAKKAKKKLSGDESKRLENVGRAIAYVQRRLDEFAGNGVVCRGQDLAVLP